MKACHGVHGVVEQRPADRRAVVVVDGRLVQRRRGVLFGRIAGRSQIIVREVWTKKEKEKNKDVDGPT